MKKTGFYLLCITLAFGCTTKKVPDVSNIKIDLITQRFERDFFLIDTSNIDQSLQRLHQQYPVFLQDFIFNILALPSQSGSSVALQQGLMSFIQSYKSIKDDGDKIFTSIADVQADIKKGMQFVKYYFPSYKLPNKIITFVGPINSYGSILTSDALAIGLQLYMGSNYPVYQSQQGQELYPTYISRRFKKEYIHVNCIKNIVDDMYPGNGAGRALIEQMIETGKKLYMLQALLPGTADTLTTGYTKDQLDGCFKNEELIWSFFVQNDLLYATDPSIIKDYMNEAPSTAVLGQASPGFIGQFVGWRIVTKWMDKNEKVTLDQLMKTDAKKIFIEAKYKP